MKDIIIESAPNGWIVTQSFGCGNTSKTLAVFNRLEDLAAKLPELLGVTPVPTVVNPNAAIGQPALLYVQPWGALSPKLDSEGEKTGL